MNRFLAGTAPVGAVEKKASAPLCVWLWGDACAKGGGFHSASPICKGPSGLWASQAPAQAKGKGWGGSDMGATN